MRLGSISLAALTLVAGGSVALGKGPAPQPKGKAGPQARADLTPGPVASQVVVRRQASLADAVRLAFSRVKGLTPSSGVVVVVDPTPAVKAARAEIFGALAPLFAFPGHPKAWQVAPLGGGLSMQVGEPSSLRSALETALGSTAKAVLDTVGALRRTMKGAAGTGGLVLYFAHAHFEDDVDLESLIEALLASKRTLCVIGPEAAFERPWLDILSDSPQWKQRGGLEYAVPGVGRNPLGPQDPKAPWHGGDTAYPQIPYTFANGAGWLTELPPGGRAEEEPIQAPGPAPDPRTDPAGFDAWARQSVVPPDREKAPEAYAKWLEKVGPPPDGNKEPQAYVGWLMKVFDSAPHVPRRRFQGDQEPRFTRDLFALPSGFGPYGLMRAAGATGGCYVLWGWEKSDASPIAYDYGRCDLFPPDLRSRAQIVADIPRRPLAMALLDAWAAMDVNPGGLVGHTPPWKGGVPAEMTHTYGEILPGIVETPKERDEVVLEAQAAIAAATSVAAAIERALTAAGEPKDDVDRRYLADAALLLHALATAKFRIGEFAASARSLEASAWKGLKKGQSPWIDEAVWLHGAPDDAEPVVEGVPLQGAAAGAALLAARKAYLEKYRGTPGGSIVSKNWVYTYRHAVWEKPDLSGIPNLPTPGTGSSSGKGPSTPPPPPSGSGGGGPTTGK